VVKRASIIAFGVSIGGAFGRIVYGILRPACTEALIEAAYYLELDLNCNDLSWQGIITWLLAGYVTGFLVVLAVEWSRCKLNGNDRA